MIDDFPPRPLSADAQLSARHLTAIKDLSDEDLANLFRLAGWYGEALRLRRAVPRRLAGKTQVNLFFENSTRTNSSFELAGKKLGADVLIIPVAASSVHKGEELKDTVQTLAAMGPDAMIVRKTENGTCAYIADVLQKGELPARVISAGEGRRSHPTQALLDAFTILEDLGRSPEDGLTGVRIAITGDIRHSRVASSNARLLQRLGAELRFAGPEALLPDRDRYQGASFHTSLKEGLEGCNYVMGLRVQFERMGDGFDFSRESYYKQYALTHKSLLAAKPGAKVLHPGPMNRGIEISGALADDPDSSLVLRQVANGVAMRMAVLDLMLGEDGA